MLSPMFGECMALCSGFLGNGVIADVALARSKAEGGGWIVISAGLGVRSNGGDFHGSGVWSKDAHINPAVTLGVAVAERNFSKLAPYVTHKYWEDRRRGSGMLHFLPHWAVRWIPSASLAASAATLHSQQGGKPDR